MDTKTLARVERHGRHLLALYPNATEQDPVKLFKRLRRLEAKAHRAAERSCNGEITDDQWDAITDKMIDDLRAILGTGPSFFINGDPRGYALKIDDATVREPMFGARTGVLIHRDMGGYGIIAPDLTAEG